ncbi:MAG TPA: hypothetical protein ENN21_00520, partial [Spirochaetes bacterium]|nr:hypothetical protein [Spirochaetota bacterium]
DHGHHLWTTAWFLLGEVDLVKAWVDSLDGILDTPSVVMWKYREGAKYGICENTAATSMPVPSKYYANDEWVEITGTHGIITVNRCNGNIKTGPPVSLFNGKKWKHYKTRCDWSEGFIDSTKNFVNALKGNEKPRLSGHEGRDILKFSLAIIRSATTRREVYLDELDVRFPRWYHWNRRRIEKRENPLRPKKTGLFGGGGTAKYAAQAAGLTEKLMERFDPSAAVGWNTVIGLALLPERGVKGADYTVTVQNGRAELKHGEINEKAVMTIRVQAGVWAALLLKKKRLEMAYIQGKLKIEGRAEEALKLREAFKL